MITVARYSEYNNGTALTRKGTQAAKQRADKLISATSHRTEKVGSQFVRALGVC